ncbi:hypothetical protein CHGG_09012 [Chaetomium globosum CBS 148.51]|uniref:Phosphotransferase n=1 Tax=Chaetomium globosum (strain ATCC 6205 / CBS 148.51 / DSM 1962 / NBRC 6347 / NRRL 1970) TaxID=306901 RepID=Q2GSP2_CHAGB|nr:uncharacterized protein CHGG_09012 [Chaetomium globosum CBS 148.51]EAQ84998.1 hypothetical protein CHGG_09012 [Chaetomium globosum CBS 148.51]
MEVTPCSTIRWKGKRFGGHRAREPQPREPRELAGSQAGARLIEGDMAILAHASQEQVDATSSLYFGLVLDTLGLEVGGVPVENVRPTQCQSEPVSPGLAPLSYLASFVFLNERLVDTQWSAPRREAKDEGVSWCGGKVVDAVDDVRGDHQAGATVSCVRLGIASAMIPDKLPGVPGVDGRGDGGMESQMEHREGFMAWGSAEFGHGKSEAKEKGKSHGATGRMWKPGHLRKVPKACSASHRLLSKGRSRRCPIRAPPAPARRHPAGFIFSVSVISRPGSGESLVSALKSLFRGKSFLKTFLAFWTTPVAPVVPISPQDAGAKANADPAADFLAEAEHLLLGHIEAGGLMQFSRKLKRQFRERLRSNPECMLPSYNSQLPSGHETGQYLALDVGGSTLRVALVELTGRGVSGPEGSIIRMDSFKIDSDARNLRGTEFFDWMAERIHRTVAKDSARGHSSDHPLLHGIGLEFSH